MIKTILFSILGCSLLLSCKSGNSDKANAIEKPAFDETAETAAIFKVIDNETKCFFDGNYECWASNWSHEKYAMQVWNNDDGTFDAAVGWEAIDKQGKSWIEKYYKNGKNVVHPSYKREKPEVKFFDEKTAYLIWKQYNADQKSKYYLVSQDSRIMEKDSTGWKIVNVSSFWNSKKRIPIDSLK